LKKSLESNKNGASVADMASSWSEVVLSPLQQRVDGEAAWWDCVAFAYAGCRFVRPVPPTAVVQRLFDTMELFIACIANALPYCSDHPVTFYGCHCPLAGPYDVPNHQIIRVLVSTGSTMVRAIMSTWEEFDRLRTDEDPHEMVRIPWRHDPIDSRGHLFGPGGVFHHLGVLPCSIVCTLGDAAVQP
jgi:hypothetical protein